MGLRILFDVNHNPVPPTIVLANRNGNKLGTIDNYYSLQLGDAFAENPQMSFKVTKKDNENITRLWDSIVDFKLVWCKEWDFWFQITVDLDDGNDTIKSIDCTPLCQSELGQIMLYDIQINTEDDIAREDYEVPTIIYNPTNASASLLNRIKEKAPHYTIDHVDTTIARLQRTFEFNGTSLQDALNEVATEIDCLVVYDNGSIDDPDGVLGKIPARRFSLYDLENTCSSCGHRGEFTDICPKCNSTNIIEGYGNDTTIFVTKDNLTEEVNFATDTDSVKNCFHLVGGDDLMTATIRNCNPNGTGYIWYISDEQKADMRESLVAKLEQYDSLYTYYDKEYVCNVASSAITAYNNLVAKYLSQNPNIERIPVSIVGYSELMNCIYDSIDFDLLLDHSLMPTVQTSETSAQEQANLLTASNLSPCAVSNYATISATTVDNNMLSIARVLVKATYQVKVKTSSYNSSTSKWTGCFTVTNYSDSEDTATSPTITVTITDNYEQFIKQKLDKSLKNNTTENYDITALFKKTITKSGNTFTGAFVNELKKYGLVSLNTFHECCQSCIDILVEQGVSDLQTWGNSNPNLYEEFYLDYLYKLKAIEAETKVRENELKVISTLNQALEKERQTIQAALNFEKYLGTTLWKEFCSYRRDDEYSNSNYISDGLSNTELFNNAREFLENAQKELYKSATLQHQISATLKNLLVIPEFEKLLDYFEVGNWIRIEVDGVIYKLRLIQYDIDFENLSTLDVTFSDVLKLVDGRSDVESILNRASSMASSYTGVERQADKGNKSYKTLNDWVKEGLDATLTKIILGADHQDMQWDSHGMLFRQYDDITESYLDEQLRIINSTIAITNDNWQTTKTAIGKFYFYDPKDNRLKIAYGVNGELIVGKMIIGETLALYNSAATMTFDEDGLMITNNTNTFRLNPNAEKLFRISNETEDLLYVNDDGDLAVKGDITATTLSAGGKTSSSSQHSGLFIDSSGNLYAGSSNQTQIKANGTFDFGSGKLTYDGSTLTVKGAIVATSLSTGSKTSANANANGIFIDSSGNLYAGSSNQTQIKANGHFSFGGTNGIIYSGNKITLGSNCEIAWDSVTGTGTVITEDTLKTVNLTATNLKVKSANIDGKITANQINTSGLIAENISATTISGKTISGCTISGGTITAVTGFSYSDSYFNTSVSDGFTVYNKNNSIATSYSIYGGGHGSCSLFANSLEFYTGSSFNGTNGSFWHDSMGFHLNRALDIGTTSIRAGNDGYATIVDCSSSGKFYYGAASDYTDESSFSALRGKTVRIYSHTSGAVYLGSSGTTAITSDENLKDIYSIDDKYVDFFNFITPVAYKYKVGHRTHLGFGAQSIENALLESGLTTEDFAGILIDENVDIGKDEHISTDNKTHFDKLYSLRYEEFIALNTMMIKKLIQRTNELEEEVRKLKATA